jgi:hypothetical protein
LIISFVAEPFSYNWTSYFCFGCLCFWGPVKNHFVDVFFCSFTVSSLMFKSFRFLSLSLYIMWDKGLIQLFCSWTSSLFYTMSLRDYLFYYYYSLIHMCIHCLGHFSPLPHSPPLSPSRTQFQEGPVLPL